MFFLWSHLVGKRDVTKEIKDMVHAQAPQDYPEGKGAAGKGAALVQLPFMLSLIRRTHLLPFLTSGLQRPRPNSGDRAEDLCLNSGVSRLQKPVQTYQALYRRMHTFAYLYRWKNQNEVQDSVRARPVIMGWSEVQSLTLAAHRGSTHSQDGDWTEGMQIALPLDCSIRIIKPKKSSPPPSLV